MREIKFRALNEETKVFVYGDLIKSQMFGSEGEKPSSSFINETPLDVEDISTSLSGGKYSFKTTFVKVIDETVGQFTGLQDKNGADIYEGDIVAILFTDWASQSKDDTRSLEEYKQSKERVFPICFNNGCFQISEICKYGDDFAYGDISCGTHGHIRVIGNIHENKELL